MDEQSLMIFIAVVFVLAFAIMAWNMIRSMPKMKREPRRRRVITGPDVARELALNLVNEAFEAACDSEQGGGLEEKFRKESEMRRDFFRKRVIDLLYEYYDEEVEKKLKTLRENEKP